MAGGGVSIINIIDESSLKNDSKDYFRNALSYTEGGVYTQSKNNAKSTVFEKKHFDELMKNI
jgi:hypothetical protein